MRARRHHAANEAARAALEPEPLHYCRPRRGDTNTNPDYTDVRDETSPLWLAPPGCMGLPATTPTLQNLSHAHLLSLRAGRALAGLVVRDIDTEVARRVMLQPQMWPGVWELMARSVVLESMGLERAEVGLEDGESSDARDSPLQRVAMGSAEPSARTLATATRWLRNEE
ncbi:uncharacterized protein M421DRAFT_9417 [Didymella exigua CBS 183.55]|uniref:Uncharacterized protein n=1 Tax=Didymella exigua CBS 183.55 TaxID=1150837 RepID=A0A6A5RDL6_9PLEO|nr:uncharacterized protein M421DRAFT_9417 [Didymella exigua CBS 183.55]KAF1923807.1 hypothetical protein M421DRAFT_9417 [Didymella exigua CBS 183.55]